MVRGVEKDFIFSVEEGMKWQCVGQRCRTRTTVGSLQWGWFQLSVATLQLTLMLTTYSVLPLCFLVLLNLDSACVSFWTMKCEHFKRWVWLPGWDSPHAWFSSPSSFLKDLFLLLLNTHSLDGRTKKNLIVAHILVYCSYHQKLWGLSSDSISYLSSISKNLKPFYRPLCSSSLVIDTNPCPHPIFWMFWHLALPWGRFFSHAPGLGVGSRVE